MVYPQQHVLLTFEWATAGGEVGQTGLRFVQSDLPTLAELNQVHGAFGLFWGAPGARVAVNYVFTGVKAAVIRPDGTYPPDAEPLYSTGANVAGGVLNGPLYPLQVACVATLETDLARGYAHAGRCYLPPIAAVLQAGDFRWSPLAVSERCGEFANTISAMNGMMVGYAAVMSRVGNGAQAAITGVRVGNRADVQRSRDHQIPETYTSLPLLP